MSAAVRDRYEYLILDCPPGISLLSENVLRAADAAVIPLPPSPLSIRMLATLQEFIAHEGWSDHALLPYFSMVDRRRALHVELVASTRARFPLMLAAEIPYWSEIERMSLRRAPLPAYAPHSAASQLYSVLFLEILARLAGGARPLRATEPAPLRVEAAAAVEPTPAAARDSTPAGRADAANDAVGDDAPMRRLVPGE